MQGIQGNIFTCKLNHLDHTHNPPVTCHFSNKKFKILYLVLNYPIECSLGVPLWSHPFHYHSNHNLGPPTCLCLTQPSSHGWPLPLISYHQVRTSTSQEGLPSMHSVICQQFSIPNHLFPSPLKMLIHSTYCHHFFIYYSLSPLTRMQNFHSLLYTVPDT